MTPTPEDVALAVQIEERAWCPAHLDNVETARLIAAHTAPLRERLEYVQVALCSAGLSPSHHDTPEKAVDGALGLISDLRGMLENPPHDVQMYVLDVNGYRELAEIGRLAVGREFNWSDPTCRYVKWLEIDIALENAVKAYLAKHPTEKP